MLILLTTYFLLGTTRSANSSVCGSFTIDDLHYYINTDGSGEAISDTIQLNDTDVHILYNLCYAMQYYCEDTLEVIEGSLIIPDKCEAYQQDEVALVGNLSEGIQVIYLKDEEVIELEFECVEGEGPGCPRVEQSIVFQYFNANQLAITITVEVIGILMMLLGIYIYRATTIIIGFCSFFFMLVTIEAEVIYLPGVPNALITNILIITGICSFFMGYLASYFPKFGLFLMGTWIGIIISLTLNNMAFYLIISSPANLTLWIVMPILAVLFGILCVFVRKTFIIFSTSLIGSYLTLRALSWHLGGFPNQFTFPRSYQLGLEDRVSWKFYLYPVAMLLLSAGSSAIQFWLFKKKVQKTHQNENFDEHFNRMESQIREDREKYIQLSLEDGKQGPRVLRKSDISSSSQNRRSSSDQEQEKEEQNRYGDLITKLISKKV